MATKKPNVSRVIMERLKALDDLPHFPDALMKIEQLLSSDEEVFIDDLSTLVAQDPRLTAGVIGVVNSAKYSPGYDISDIGEAVNRLGTTDIRMMAHAINYKSAIKTKPPFSEKEFMQHAMLAAFIAQALAQQVHIDQGEAFLCGLMHDIGVYLLATENREQYKEVIRMVAGDINQLIKSEQHCFKATHPIVGARLLKQWKFPADIIMGVAYHHAPGLADEKFQPYAYLTYLAEQGALFDGVTNGVATLVEEEMPELVYQALEYFGLNQSGYHELVEDALEEAQNSGLIS